MIKGLLDILFAFTGLFLLGWFLISCWLLASIYIKSNELFIDKRIRQFGKSFDIYKLNSIRVHHGQKTISYFGNFIRKTKIYEQPQLINTLKGNMSFVRPRPDVLGYCDQLMGADR
jgi:lipopolysaccharide/colanic/teichoic acid biosynthesis glycosyltransferase